MPRFIGTIIPQISVSSQHHYLNFLTVKKIQEFSRGNWFPVVLSLVSEYTAYSRVRVLTTRTVLNYTGTNLVWQLFTSTYKLTFHLSVSQVWMRQDIHNYEIFYFLREVHCFELNLVKFFILQEDLGLVTLCFMLLVFSTSWHLYFRVTYPKIAAPEYHRFFFKSA